MAAPTSPTLRNATRRALLDLGLELLETRGYAAVSLADISEAAGQPLAEVYRHFGSKNDFVLGLYQRIHDELEAHAPDLPTGPLALRFQALVSEKLTLLTPYSSWATRACAGSCGPRWPARCC